MFFGHKVRAIGMVWYKRQNYARILQVMADADVLPTTFDKWQSRAEKFEREQIRAGNHVMRVHIEPDEFVTWCTERGLRVDVEARNRFANETVFASVGRPN